MDGDLLLMVAAWSAAIVGLTGAMKALGWLWRTSLLPGFHTLRRASKAVVKLAAIGDEESWPNGSTDLPTFLDRLYRSVTKLLEYHQEDLQAWEQGRPKRRVDD